jgi:hypothetical protein
MYKIKKKYLGKTLKGGGVSVALDEKLNQRHLDYVFRRWGKEYVTFVKPKVEKDVENTESTGE